MLLHSPIFSQTKKVYNRQEFSKVQSQALETETSTQIRGRGTRSFAIEGFFTETQLTLLIEFARSLDLVKPGNCWIKALSVDKEQHAADGSKKVKSLFFLLFTTPKSGRFDDE